MQGATRLCTVDCRRKRRGAAVRREGLKMRAIIDVLRAIGLWLATGGVGVRRFVVTLPPPDADVTPERRVARGTVRPERRVAARV